MISFFLTKSFIVLFFPLLAHSARGLWQKYISDALSKKNVKYIHISFQIHELSIVRVSSAGSKSKNLNFELLELSLSLLNPNNGKLWDYLSQT